MSVTLFRQTKLADSLVETLDTLVNEGKIPGKLALRILHEVSDQVATFTLRLGLLYLCRELQLSVTIE